MKIPQNIYVSEESRDVVIWAETAAKLSMEYGIFVQVEAKKVSSPNSCFAFVEEIWFQVGERRFDSLRELRKALRNRAFL
jgi:hypothetical protein